MSVESMPPAALTSPLLAEFDSADASLGVVHGMRIVERIAQTCATENFLADLSAVPRRLVCGRGAAAWLTAAGLTPPAQEQGWQVVAGEALIARPHRGQYLVVDAPRRWRRARRLRGRGECRAGRAGERLAAGGTRPRRPACAAILAELCALELSLGNEYWCLTRLAHCEVALWLRTAPTVHVRINARPRTRAISVVCCRRVCANIRVACWATPTSSSAACRRRERGPLSALQSVAGASSGGRPKTHRTPPCGTWTFVPRALFR